MKNEATELAVNSAALKVAVGSGVATFFAGWTINHVVAIGGLLVAISGLLIQNYYTRREDRRREERHRVYIDRKRFAPYEDDPGES